MRDLQLSGGDLVVAARGFATVTGAPYLQQRIALALGEPYGGDPYNPSWGSTLPSMLGSPSDPGTPALVSSEISRVMQVLVAAQQTLMAGNAMSGTRSQLSADDVIASVDSVSAQVSADPQAIRAAVSLTTMAGTQTTVTRTLSLA